MASEPAQLLVTNRRVDEAYQQTACDDYLSAYRQYVEYLTGGQPMPWQVTSELYISVMRPDAPVHVESFTREGRNWKSLKPEEPAPSLSPCEISYHRGILYAGGVHDPSQLLHFGLELNYPRVLFFASDGYEAQHDASTYPNASLFANCCQQIRALTKPCRIESPTKVHRTRIRISPEMRIRMQDNPRLLAHGLRVL